MTGVCSRLTTAGVLFPGLLLLPTVETRQGLGCPLLQVQLRDGKAASLQTPQQLVMAVLNLLEPMGFIHGHRQGSPVETEGAAVLGQSGASPAGPLPTEPGHGAARPLLLHLLQATVQCLWHWAPGWPQHLRWPHPNTVPQPGCLHHQAHNYSRNSSTTGPEPPTVGSLYSWKQDPQPMTSNNPPANPNMQPQATTTTVPASDHPGRRPWLEPAVVVAAIGGAVTILGLLLSIALGIYGMNVRIDDLGIRMDGMSTRIDDLGTRMDTLGAEISARMDTLGANLSTRIDNLAARMDTLGADLSARIDNLATRMDGLSVRMDKVYQLLLAKQS